MDVKIKKTARLFYGVLSVIIILSMNPFALHGNQVYVFRLDNKVSVGDDGVIFRYIKSVCEDDDENFYVLDMSAYTVYKFSNEGKLLLPFGRKGQGPGDFTFPYEVFFSQDKKIIVTEIFNIVSYFDTNGKYLDKTNFSGKFRSVSDLCYVGGNNFYGCISKNNQDESQQIIFNGETGNTLRSLYKSSFLTAKIALEGELIQAFGIPFSESTPGLIFSYYNGFSAAAYNRKYEITIMNAQGEPVSKVTRSFPPPEFSQKEIDYHKQMLKNKKWPDQAKKRIMELMPKTKNIISFIYVSDNLLFIFRTPDDIAQETLHYPVDIYTLEGEFQGTTTTDFYPYLITKKYLYRVEEDDKGEMILSRYNYKLIKKQE